MKGIKLKKSLKYGAASTLFTVIFLVGVLLVNVVVGLAGRVVDLTIDLTPNSVYQITDDTYQLLDGIEKNVDIYIFKSEASMDDVAMQYLRKYDIYSDKIALHTADLNVNPAFAREYGVTSTDQILFVSDIRSKTVNVSDIYYTNSYTGSSGICAEYRFSSAIKFVTASKIPTMVFLTGHNEASDASNFAYAKALASDNCYKVETVDLRYNDIPQDATYINIVGPTLDFTLEEIDKIDLFLTRKTEGAYTLAVYLNYTAELPNLYSFLSEWGILPQYEMAYETSAFIGGRAYNISAQYGESSIVSTFKGTVALPRSLHLNTEYRENFTVTPIFTTTAKAYSVDVSKVNLDDDGGDEEIDAKLRRLKLGVHSQTSASAGSRVVDYNVIVFGSTDMLADEILTAASYVNDKVVVACYETAVTEDTTFYVLPKYYVDSTLDIPDAESTVYIILLAAVVAVLLAGAGVAFARRYHK